MLRYILMLCCILVSAKGHDVPDFNFTLFSRHNETGNWYATVQLGHQEGNIWDVYVDHTTVIWNTTKSILIDAKIIAPIIINENLTSPDCNALISKGYELISGLGCYKFFKNRTTWKEAVEICRKDGTQLLIISSRQEEEAIMSLIDKANKSRNWFWVGVHDQYEEGQYITIFNQTLASTDYVNWLPGYPSGGTARNCLWFYYETRGRYGLVDGTCTDDDQFLCEQKIS